MFSFSILFYVSIITSYIIPLCQAIALTDAGCGESKGCVRIPSDCTQPDCDLLATYRSQGEEVTFELFGRGADWVAIGFSDDTLMLDSDAVFCYKNNGQVIIRSGRLTGYELPPLKEEPDLILTSQSTDDGSVMCSFRHPLRPNVATTLRNLDESIFLIYAKGRASSGSNLERHTDRGVSNSRVNITRTFKPVEKKKEIDDGCGESKGCLRVPSGCTQSDCDFLATYQGQEEQVTFELFGRDVDWVSIGFNNAKSMIGTDAVFCYKNNGQVIIRSGKLTAYQLPPLQEEPGLILTSQSTDDGSVMCSFRHPVRPNVATTLRNLDESIFLIYAEGRASSGSNLQKHTKRGFSNSHVNITRGFKPVEKKKEVDDGCGESKGCLRVPSGCTQSDCDFLATYQRQGEQVTFELFGRDVDWVSIGFNDAKSMISTDAVFCYKNNGQVIIRSGKLTAYQLPPLQEEPDLKLMSQSTADGSVMCSFQHPLRPNVASTLRNLEESLFLIYARGPASSGSNLQKHSQRGFSDARVNVSRNFESIAKSPSDIKRRVHGSVMIVVWIFLASIGLFFARYTRNVWSDVTLFELKVWFQFHRFLMIVVVLGTIASITVIFVEVDGFTKGKDLFKVHAILGLVVLSLAVLQPIGAIFRPHPGTAKRPIFNFIHRLFGLSAFILSLAASVLGLEIFDKRDGFKVLLGYVGFLVLVIIIMEIVKFIHENKEKESHTDVLPGGMGMSTPIAEMNTAYLTLSKIFLGIVVLVSLVVAAVLIYFINDSKN